MRGVWNRSGESVKKNRRLLPEARGHKFSMPTQDGFGSHDGGKLVEHLAAEDLAFDGEPASLAVVEEYSFLSELFLEYLILSEEVLDGVLLPGLIQPARMRSNKCPG